ncbi:hypothetical protein VP5_016 [Vibrio virus VPMCC5]|nr:hypothetical protein VP5_016 [Vibrio virus VPMCC5]
MIDVIKEMIMDRASYEFMKVGVEYNAYYKLGGKCKIKKAAEDQSKSLVTATMPDGTVKQRHYEFFTLLMEAND